MRFICIIVCFSLLSGFRSGDAIKDFNINELYEYQREYESYDVGVCSMSPVKTYESYRAITDEGSEQYKFISKYMHVDEETGLLVDNDGFIGVALGSYYGSKIGTRYYITLDTGVVIPAVMVDQKDNRDTDSTNCYHTGDNSVIEFVIDPTIARNYFNVNGYSITNAGNFNNFAPFNGSIVKFEIVVDSRNENYVTFIEEEANDLVIKNDFYYASGY